MYLGLLESPCHTLQQVKIREGTGCPSANRFLKLKFQSDTRRILQGSVDLGSGTETPVELRKERGAPKPELADVSDYSCKSSNLSIFR